MKIGMVSFAHMHAYSYASALSRMDGVEISGVTDEDEARGKAAAEQFHTVYYKSYDDLLKVVDAVVVCNENAKHADAVIAAANAGKHVLCEKPIATNVEEAQRMIDACRKNNVKLQIAFPCRFNAPVQRVRQMVQNGDLGRIVCIRGTNRGQNPGGWFIQNELSGGGAVLDHTVHVVDLMRWFMNSEVKEVYAEVDTKFNDINSDDCGLLTLEFDNGVFATHDPSWSRCKSFPTWGDVTLEIIGTNGVTQVDAFAQHLAVYSDKENRVSQHFWGNSMDDALLADFVRCVRDDLEPSITGEDGLRAMEVALAAYESARRQKPVALSH